MRIKFERAIGIALVLVALCGPATAQTSGLTIEPARSVVVPKDIRHGDHCWGVLSVEQLSPTLWAITPFYSTRWSSSAIAVDPWGTFSDIPSGKTVLVYMPAGQFTLAMLFLQSREGTCLATVQPVGPST